MNTPKWPCRIKSARRKRRLVKTDRDKQLIQLYKRRKELWEQQKQLPWVPLDQPYQRGWKRFFVLREDVKRSPKAEFYEALLTKINTTDYHHDRSFRVKKHRKARHRYVVEKQLLRGFDVYDWKYTELNLSEQERACFTLVEIHSGGKTQQSYFRYVFTEPWRYVLKVAPHIVTHRRLKDSDIERELARIDNHINNYDLAPRIALLTQGRGYRWNGWYCKPTKHINKFKNIPRYANKEAYLELET